MIVLFSVVSAFLIGVVVGVVWDFPMATLQIDQWRESRDRAWSQRDEAVRDRNALLAQTANLHRQKVEAKRPMRKRGRR